MSKKTYVYCDVDGCNKKIGEDKMGVRYTISGKVDRRADAAGSMENVHKRGDICGRCARKILNNLLTDMSCDEVDEFFKEHVSKDIIGR